MIVTPRMRSITAKTVRLEDSAARSRRDGDGILPNTCHMPRGKDHQDVIDYIKLLKQEKCELQGTYDPDVECIRVLGSSSS